MRRQLDFSDNSLVKAIKRQLLDRRTSLFSTQNRLEALSPLSVLNRGYSITRTIDGRKVIRDAESAKEGNRVQVILSKGELECRVEISKPDRDDPKADVFTPGA
jgi:exodeoxyribonuclease VII large subunit